VVKSHLIKRGFKKSYIIRTSHGETDNALLEVDRGQVTDGNSHYQDGGVFDGADHGIDDDDFDYEELLHHVEPQVLNSMGTDRGLDNMEILEKSSSEPLYDESNSCGKEFTQLRVMLELLKLKASHGWSDNSFLELLSLLGKLLPKPNTLSTSTYRAKKLICLLSLGVDKIDACRNHCILYRKEHEFKMKCLVCGVSRYKRSYNHVYVDTMKKKNKKNTTIGPESVDDKNDSDKEDNKKRKLPALVMWYLPVIDHLKCVFSNPRDVELVPGHSETRRKNNEEIRHPTAGTQWKFFDLQYKPFGSESKNIRFALSTDGMNPFGENKTVYSTWLVILAMYNLLTWLCHKRMYLILSILIQGLKQVGIDIDVFLEPLIEDMAKLWNEGVRMWDQYQQEYFTLYAIIFICIHDAPGGFTLLGQTKGKSGTCPVCVDGTTSVYLPSSKKLVYIRHRWFLPTKHKYCKMKMHFDNTVEKDSALKQYTRKLVFEMLKNIEVVFGKGVVKG
jgi:hypothetical protein